MKKILIKNADWIITMDEEKSRLRNSDVLIEGREIIGVGENLIDQSLVDEVIDARGRILMPGMVNTHHHCFQSLTRNITACNEVDLMPWLTAQYKIFEELTPEAVDAGALIGLGGLLKSGCTTAADHHYAFPNKIKRELIDVEIESAQKLGIRFYPTRGSLTLEGAHIPKGLVEEVDDVLNDCERLINTYHDDSKFSMLQIGLSPTWPQFDMPSVWEGSLELAKKYGVRIHSHLAEGVDEVKYSREKYNCTPTEYVYDKGWMGSNVWYAHSIHLTDTDIEKFAETGTGVAHCPVCNMKVNSGVARVPDLLAAGVNIGLGVDGAASSNSSNMMTDIRVAYLVHQLTYGSRGPTAEKILEMATIGGAKILGREDIGRIKVGMAADLVLFDWSRYELSGGCNDPVSAIVMSSDSQMIDKVLVNGELVVDGGRLVNIDEESTGRHVNAVAKKLLASAAHKVVGLEQDIR